MRSCKAPISDASVGWYPTADGKRPSKVETSEPACEKRKILSINKSISRRSSSLKYSAIVSAVSAHANARPALHSFDQTLVRSYQSHRIPAFLYKDHFLRACARLLPQTQNTRQILRQRCE